MKKKTRILNDDTPASAGAESHSPACLSRALPPVVVKGIQEPVRVVTLGGKA